MIEMQILKVKVKKQPTKMVKHLETMGGIKKKLFTSLNKAKEFFKKKPVNLFSIAISNTSNEKLLTNNLDTILTSEVKCDKI